MMYLFLYDGSQPIFQILSFSAVHLHTLAETNSTVLLAAHFLGQLGGFFPLVVAEGTIAFVEYHVTLAREGENVHGTYGFGAQEIVRRR